MYAFRQIITRPTGLIFSFTYAMSTVKPSKTKYGLTRTFCNFIIGVVIVKWYSETSIVGFCAAIIGGVAINQVNIKFQLILM